MNSKNDSRPFISHKKGYLKKVAGSISEKPPLEDIPFHYLTDVLSALGIKDNPYPDVENFDGEYINQLAEKSFISIPQDVDKTLSEKLYTLWDYLAEADQLSKGDLIFVFGSANEECPRLAAHLYLNEYAPRILFTGHSAIYQEKMQMSEAERFAQIAEEIGVPRENMILENTSRNTPENAINGIRILKEHDLKPESIIIITYSFHMRRAYLTLRSVMDWNAKLIRQPVSIDKRENFFRDKKRWTYIFFEFVKLRGARMMKHF